MLLFYAVLIGIPFSMALLYASQRKRNRGALAKSFSEEWFAQKEDRFFERLFDFLVGIGAIFSPLAIIIICDFITNKFLGKLIGHPDNPDYENSHFALTYLVVSSLACIIIFSLYYDAKSRGNFNQFLIIVLSSIYFTLNLLIMLFNIYLPNGFYNY